jgi:hypothetical protein
MANKKPKHTSKTQGTPHGPLPEVSPQAPEFLISVVQGNLAIRGTPISFPPEHEMKRESIDQFLNPEFISRLAAKLWEGDDDACVSKVLALIQYCAEKLSLRKLPLSDIETFGQPQARPSARNSRFWKRFSLEFVINIAATVSRLREPHDAVEIAFSIIESAGAALEKLSKAPDEQPKPGLDTTDGERGPANLASVISKAFKPHWTWKDAAQRITGIRRPDRAEETLRRFLLDPSVWDGASLSDPNWKRAVAGKRKMGFSLNEVLTLEVHYKDWHLHWVRSKQSNSGKKVGKKNLRKGP